MKRLVILGAGESGVGAAMLARKHGIPTFVSDDGLIRPNYKEIIVNLGIDYEEGRHTAAKILKATEIVKSPGIPDAIPILIEARKKNIPIISEIEFASRYCKGKKICITGSNGKTTTTLLIHHILQQAGVDVGLGGNVGKSFAAQLCESDHAYWVLEISSFQLDGMIDFKAEIAILTNITPDHFDRYDYSFEKYAESKFRIVQNQTQEDAFIYCLDDPMIVRGISRLEIKSKHYPYTLYAPLNCDGAFIKKRNIKFTIQTNTFYMKLEELALQGRHNTYNSMASGIAARLLEIRKEVVKTSLTDFQNIEHRLEFVARVHGVEFINDSKATNVNSSWFALESMNKPVIWIVGGVDKGNDYEILNALVRGKVKAIVCLGLDNQRIEDAFAGMVPEIIHTQSMNSAVQTAYSLSNPGDVVLLSPACASFDLFENFEERGKSFKDAVRDL